MKPIEECGEPSWWLVGVLTVNAALFVMQLILAWNVSDVKRDVVDALKMRPVETAAASVVQPSEKIVSETHYVRVVLEGKGN